MIGTNTPGTVSRVMRSPFYFLLLLLVFAAAPLHAEEPEQLTPTDAASLMEYVHEQDAKAVLVNFWSTWCKPCKEEMPALVKLQEDLGDRGFQLIFVSMDFDRLATAARDTLIDKGGSLPSFIKQQRDNEFIAGVHSEWYGALPASFLYDSEGNLVEWWNSARTYEQFREAIEPLLSN